MMRLSERVFITNRAPNEQTLICAKIFNARDVLIGNVIFNNSADLSVLPRTNRGPAAVVFFGHRKIEVFGHRKLYNRGLESVP